MRIGLFTNNYLPFRGGVSSAVETLREGLEGAGHRAWVFAPASVVPDPPFVFRYPSVPALTYPGFRLALPFSPRIARAAGRLGLDIIHAHHPFLLGRTARRLAGRWGRPLVFTYHTRYEKYAHYVPLPERFVAALALRLSCRFADSAALVVAPSERIAGMLRERGVRSPVTVLPTGVPLDRFRPGEREAARRRSGLPGDGPLCLYVGRLDPEKSVERVIEAFGCIADRVAGVRLLLVGEGSHREVLERAARRSPAGERIRFHGGVARERLPILYQAADLFLFASETETQGLVLAEAHACGLPGVAVRAWGVDEVVRDGETGFLTKPEASELAAAAIGLLLDPSRREAMGRAARAVAESHFSVSAQVQAMVARYRELREAAP